MPFQPIHFDKISFEEANPWMTGLSRGLSIGDQIRQAMYAPQMNQAELQLKQAQAQRELARANLPFGGESLPGVAGQIVGLEAIRKMYGDNSPQYQQAQKAFQLDQQSDLSRIMYQNKLANTADIRALTPMGKGYVEQNYVGAGLSPTGQPWAQGGQLPLNQEQINSLQQKAQQLGYQAPSQNAPEQFQQSQPMQSQGQFQAQNITQPSQMSQSQKIEKNIAQTAAPGSPQELAEQYKLERLKKITDQPTRIRALKAYNLEVTSNRIDPKILLQYSGIANRPKLLRDNFLDQIGQAPPEYVQYKKMLQDAIAHAKEVRNFLGDSIQPIVGEKLEKLSNPDSWKTSPETAVAQLNEYNSLLEQEIDTLQRGLKGTQVYFEKPQKPQREQMQPSIGQQNSQSKIKVIDKNGKAWGVSPDKLEEALASGYRRG